MDAAVEAPVLLRARQKEGHEELNRTPFTGFDDSTYLRQRPPQLPLTLLQLQSFGAVGVLQAQHGILALPQLCVQLLQLTPEGQHLTGPLRHLRLTLPQLLLEQRDFSCLLTHLPNKARG